MRNPVRRNLYVNVSPNMVIHTHDCGGIQVAQAVLLLGLPISGMLNFVLFQQKSIKAEFLWVIHV